MRPVLGAALAVVAGTAAVLGCVAYREQASASARYTTGVFHGCEPTGDSLWTGKGDPDLNARKNRDKPGATVTPMDLASLLKNHPSKVEGEGNRHRSEWSQEARDEISAMEEAFVSIDGYLIKMKHEGPEACNCHSNADKDYHLWLALPREDGTLPGEGEALVVEISPRTMAQHQQQWRISWIEGLISERKHVRITGWLMWDQEHGDMIGKARGSNWEIHPIHGIVVLDR